MQPPGILDLVASESGCPATAAGWLWYCDEHDSHGNADFEDDARAVGRAHSAWHLGGEASSLMGSSPPLGQSF